MNGRMGVPPHGAHMRGPRCGIGAIQGSNAAREGIAGSVGGIGDKACAGRGRARRHVWPPARANTFRWTGEAGI